MNVSFAWGRILTGGACIAEPGVYAVPCVASRGGVTVLRVRELLRVVRILSFILSDNGEFLNVPII